jgi:large subunit ribosomal protein L24
VKSAQIAFNIRDGGLRVGATTLDADGARAVISGGYDIPADQADIRAVLASTAAGQTASRPEIQLFAVGSPDALDRTIDVATLSSWLAIRAIDRETRRLDSIARGEAPATSASIPQAPGAQPPDAAPNAAEIPGLGRDPRRLSPVAKPVAPRPPLSGAPVASQLAPLPPPIEIRPVPGATPRLPKSKPPLVLTPPAAIPPR